MEHTSDLVFEGKLIHETTYPQRSEKYSEIEIDGIKIDYFDAKNKIIHEIKKSDKLEISHEWQIKFYIYTLLQNGTEGVKGILEYPKLRQKKEVYLSSLDIEELHNIVNKILQIAESETAPDKNKLQRCKKCSYFDFCWVDEIGEN